MPETLSGLAREIGQVIRDQSHTAQDALALAERLEAFAAGEPALSPDSRINLLTQLARTVDPTCPRDAARAMARLLAAAYPHHRYPYVGEGVDGARRSAQIDREESDGLDRADPRYPLLLESAARWDQQATELDSRAEDATPPRQ